MIHRIALSQLQKISLIRPPRYSEDVISRGKIEGGLLLLEDSIYRELQKKYGESKGLGDKIEKLATPIARALKLPCIDKKTGQLKPESGCAKMKKRLNEGMPIAEAMKLRIKGE